MAESLWSSLKRELDKSEVARLIAAAEADSPRSHALVLLLALNGCRISEILSADVTDLGWERGHRVLRITRKGGKRAVVPLAPRTAEALDAYLGGRDTEPLFITMTGARLDRSAAWRIIARLAQRAAGFEAHPHSLRHGFASLSLDAGVPLQVLQDAMGHADPRTTRRYDDARHNLDKAPTYLLAGQV